MCAACSIISVLTQWGATLVIKLRERERERGATLVIKLRERERESARASPTARLRTVSGTARAAPMALVPATTRPPKLARQRGYRTIDTGSRWLAKKIGASGLSVRLRWRGDDQVADLNSRCRGARA